MLSSRNKIDDKFIRGTIAGVIGGLLKDVPALVFRLIFKNPHPTFWDYMSLLAIGQMPRTWDEYLFAIITQVFWCTFLAIVFVYFQPSLKSKHYILHGGGYGLFIWLMIRTTVYFFKAPDLIHSRPLTALANASISAFYGIIIALVDHKLKCANKSGQ